MAREERPGWAARLTQGRAARLARRAARPEPRDTTAARALPGKPRTAAAPRSPATPPASSGSSATTRAARRASATRPGSRAQTTSAARLPPVPCSCASMAPPSCLRARRPRTGASGGSLRARRWSARTWRAPRRARTALTSTPKAARRAPASSPTSVRSTPRTSSATLARPASGWSPDATRSRSRRPVASRGPTSGAARTRTAQVSGAVPFGASEHVRQTPTGARPVPPVSRRPSASEPEPRSTQSFQLTGPAAAIG